MIHWDWMWAMTHTYTVVMVPLGLASSAWPPGERASNRWSIVFRPLNSHSLGSSETHSFGIIMPLTPKFCCLTLFKLEFYLTLWKVVFITKWWQIRRNLSISLILNLNHSFSLFIPLFDINFLGWEVYVCADASATKLWIYRVYTQG